MFSIYNRNHRKQYLCLPYCVILNLPFGNLKLNQKIKNQNDFAKKIIRNEVFIVGITGFEPVTSTLSR
jgi:hypothetical protein